MRTVEVALTVLVLAMDNCNIDHLALGSMHFGNESEVPPSVSVPILSWVVYAVAIIFGS